MFDMLQIRFFTLLLLFVSIFEFALGIFHQEVVNLTDSSFDETVLASKEPWLVEFFEPWCSNCKVLGREWAKAATKLKGKIKMGALDAIENPDKPSELSMEGSYPKIKYFPPGNKKKVNEYDPPKAEDYDGGQTMDEIISWTLKKLYNDTVKPDIKLTQFLMDDVFVDNCRKNTLCVLLFLPKRNACGPGCRYSLLKTLQTSENLIADKSLMWGWTHAGDLYYLEDTLEIKGADFPLLIAIHPRSTKYDILLPPFNQDEISKFVTDLANGDIHKAHKIRENTLFPKVERDEL